MIMYVDVITPGNGKAYEFRLDSQMTVRQAKDKMISEIVEVEAGNIELPAGIAVLCGMSAQMALPDSDTLASAGVKSGHSLILI